MNALPSLFDSRGAFVELPSDILDSLDDARAATYQKIKRCADDLKAADAAVAVSICNIKLANDAVVKHDAFMASAFKPITHHDLWLAEVKGK
jgi:hypothetical protein